MGTNTLDEGARQGEVPAPVEPPARQRHRFATALAWVVGAVLLLGVGATAGVLWGSGLLWTYAPGVAEGLGLVQASDSVLEQLEDGYDGELARRVAAVSAELGRTAYRVPSLDDATAATLQGLLASADPHALYLDPEDYARSVDVAENSQGDALVEGSLVDGAGVIVVHQLTPGVADAVADRVESLRGEGASSFVLDLRGNPGGSLHEAVLVASLFMNGGTVAEVINADGTVDRVAADPSAQVATEPLAVLVASDTGSAAEALAGALQDHRRALLVGAVTAGRGGVQVVKTLSFGGAVVYAVSAFRTPDGYVVDGRGIAPDVVLPMDEGARSLDPLTDIQLAAALEVVRAWGETGSIDIEWLSNAPGPQADAVDQARALERSLQEAGAQWAEGIGEENPDGDAADNADGESTEVPDASNEEGTLGAVGADEDAAPSVAAAAAKASAPVAERAEVARQYENDNSGA